MIEWARNKLRIWIVHGELKRMKASESLLTGIGGILAFCYEVTSTTQFVVVIGLVNALGLDGLSWVSD